MPTSTEYQIKVVGTVSEDKVLALGARKIARVVQRDIYYIPSGVPFGTDVDIIRVRKEGERSNLTRKRVVTTGRGKKLLTTTMLARSVRSGVVDEKKLSAMLNGHTEVLTVDKTREIYLLGGISITRDHVENIGDFVEFVAVDEATAGQLPTIMNRLGLNPKNSTRLTYLELGLMLTSPTRRIFVKIYDRFGRFSFGIASAVLTTLGIIIGVNSATSARLAVIGGIISVALADSSSDAMGMYADRKSERGVTTASAMRSALNVFIGKLVFTMTFIVPFLLLAMTPAIYVSILWGALLLAFVHTQIAIVQEESVPRTVLTQLAIAAMILLAAYAGGLLVAAVFG